jgi:glycogen operon protein
VRDFWRGTPGLLPELATRLSGSADLYADDGRTPFHSVNFVTAHDGFTLRDLVSYDGKHNEANGEDNRDGANDNRSWNSGAEGPTDDPEVLARRLRRHRSLLTTLLLSTGTPMLLGGDEMGNTQHGNNNAYCQDNEISWLDWNAAEGAQALVDFLRHLTSLRRKYPILRRNRFLTGAVNERIGIKEITWIHASGAEMTPEQWEDATMLCFGMILDGRAQPTGLKQRGTDATILIVLNPYHDVVNFILPQSTQGRHWERVIDTNIPAGEHGSGQQFEPGKEYVTTGRSLLAFVLRPNGK